jgi:hypothetical protein
MNISMGKLVREVVFKISKAYIWPLISTGVTVFILKMFIFKPEYYLPGIAEIFDISLIFTFLFLRVKITKISWLSILSEIFLIGITSSLIYVIWHSLLFWRYSYLCQYIKIEHVIIIKVIYVVCIYLYEFSNKLLPKKEKQNFNDESPLPLF